MPLTEDFNRREEQWLGVENPGLVKASTTIYKGGLTAVDATGYTVPAANTAGHKVTGVSVTGADNSAGANGAITVDVHVGDLFQFSTSGATQAWREQIVYVVNDDVVALTDPGNSVKAGIVKRVDSATVVWIWVLTEEMLANVSATTVDGIPLHSWRAADMAAMGIVESPGDHFLNLGTNTLTLDGEEAISETEVSVSWYQYRIPYNYLAAGTIGIRINHVLTGAGTNNGSTIDFSAYEQTDGAVGADLVTTAAQAMQKTTYVESTFVVTPTGLVPGDILNIKLSTSVIESAGSALAATIDRVAVVYQRSG
jgi:hypothetical protein